MVISEIGLSDLCDRCVRYLGLLVFLSLRAFFHYFSLLFPTFPKNVIVGCTYFQQLTGIGSEAG
jgi:hypothetical protein